MNQSSLNRGRVNYQCANCEKGFRTLGGYNRHQRPEPGNSSPKGKQKSGQSKCAKYLKRGELK